MEPPSEPQGVPRLHIPAYLFTLVLDIKLIGEIASKFSKGAIETLWSDFIVVIDTAADYINAPRRLAESVDGVENCTVKFNTL